MKPMRSVLCLVAFVVGVWLPTSAAAGNCGCYKALKKCMKDRETSADGCTDSFETCITACNDKKKCVDECGKYKKSYKRVCQARFKQTECPLKGKQAKACKKEARKIKNRCLKRNQTFSKLCKRRCKQQQ